MVIIYVKTAKDNKKHKLILRSMFSARETWGGKQKEKLINLLFIRRNDWNKLFWKDNILSFN
jgi:hypothetical protein